MCKVCSTLPKGKRGLCFQGLSAVTVLTWKEARCARALRDSRPRRKTTAFPLINSLSKEKK